MTKIIILLFVFVFSSCGKISQKNSKETTEDSTQNKNVKTENRFDKDMPGYSFNHHSVSRNDLNDDETILETTENMEWVFGKNYKPWTPDETDIGNAEEMIKKCFDDQAMGTVNRVLGRKPSDYCKQFMGAVSSDGEKILWINFFCKTELEHFKNWQKNLVFVNDGGNCFVQIKFNWTKNDGHYEMKVNGEG